MMMEKWIVLSAKQLVVTVSGRFKEKGPVCSLWLGALQWHEISILVDPKRISVVSKSEKKRKKEVLCLLQKAL